MYYCHTRLYNPLWRRRLTPDNPCYLNQEIISGMNLFVYCNNNPVMNVDEEGMFWITLSIGLSIGTYEFSMNSYSDLSLMVGRSFDEEEDVTNIGVLSNCNALLG